MSHEIDHIGLQRSMYLHQLPISRGWNPLRTAISSMTGKIMVQQEPFDPQFQLYIPGHDNTAFKGLEEPLFFVRPSQQQQKTNVSVWIAGREGSSLYLEWDRSQKTGALLIWTRSGYGRENKPDFFNAIEDPYAASRAAEKVIDWMKDVGPQPGTEERFAQFISIVDYESSPFREHSGGHWPYEDLPQSTGIIQRFKHQMPSPLQAQTAAAFDPDKQTLHSDFVDSAKFFGPNGLLRLAMFVNVMTRPEQGEPDLFKLTIPSQQEGHPAIEVTSLDGDVARFEPFAFSQEGQWTRMKAVMGGETKVYGGLPHEELENEIITRFNNWCMAHHPKEHVASFFVRWDNAFKDVGEVADNLAAQRATDRRPS